MATSEKTYLESVNEALERLNGAATRPSGTVRSMVFYMLGSIQIAARQAGEGFPEIAVSPGGLHTEVVIVSERWRLSQFWQECDPPVVCQVLLLGEQFFQSRLPPMKAIDCVLTFLDLDGRGPYRHGGGPTVELKLG